MNGWTERHAVFAHDPRSGVVVETTWWPAIAGLGVAALTEAHARELGRDPDGCPGGTPSAAATGDRTEQREYHLPGSTVVARYAERGDRLVRTVAAAAPGTPVTDLTAALEIAGEQLGTALLTDVEVRYLESLLDLPPVSFLGAAWWHELDGSVRALIGHELSRGLVGRGVLVPVGNVAPAGAASNPEPPRTGEQPTPDVLRAVLPILDGDLVAIARRAGDDASYAVVLGRRAGDWSLLREALPGTVEFVPVTGAEVATRLLDELGMPRDIPVLTEAALDDVDNFPVLWHIALVRAGTVGLDSAELAWCLDDNGKVWSVLPEVDADGRPRLEPTGSRAVRDELATLFDPVARSQTHPGQGRSS